MPPMSDLNAVACASDTECWAVGSLLTPTDALFEEYTGGSWTAVYSPDGGGVDFDLQGITCLPSGDCWVVGRGPGPGAAIVYYDGNGWTVVSSPPGGAGGDQLNGIACVSSEDCWAVGFSGVADDANKEPLIEHYAAGVWMDVSGPSPVAQGTLAAVSCATSTDCWAVGTSYVASGHQGPAVIEHYDGSAWTLVTGAPVGAPGELSGVTCSTSTECWAVGVSYEGGSSAPTGGPFIAPVIEQYDGSSWTLVASPTADSAFLADVTCPSPADCWAVGEDNQTLTAGTLIEHYTGSGWSVVASPSLAATTDDEILGIACPSTTECWAAGTINYTGFPEQAFIDAGATPP